MGRDEGLASFLLRLLTTPPFPTVPCFKPHLKSESLVFRSNLLLKLNGTPHPICQSQRINRAVLRINVLMNFTIGLVGAAIGFIWTLWSVVQTFQPGVQ